MSFDLMSDPYDASEWAEKVDGAARLLVVDVQILSATELADLCEQAFCELDSERPAFGTLDRYQELVDEIRHRELAGR